jgi:hypothetical protein
MTSDVVPIIDDATNLSECSILTYNGAYTAFHEGLGWENPGPDHRKNLLAPIARRHLNLAFNQDRCPFPCFQDEGIVVTIMTYTATEATYVAVQSEKTGLCVGIFLINNGGAVLLRTLIDEFDDKRIFVRHLIDSDVSFFVAIRDSLVASTNDLYHFDGATVTQDGIKHDWLTLESVEFASMERLHRRIQEFSAQYGEAKQVYRSIRQDGPSPLWFFDFLRDHVWWN